MGATPQIPLGSFDPANVVLTVAGETVVGAAKGTFYKVARDSDSYTDDVGGAGDVVRVKSNDNRGTVEITLMQSSPSNDALNDLAQRDEALGTGLTPFEIVDLNGRTMASGINCWIRKKADTEFSTEATNRVWILRVPNLAYTVGGIV